MHNVSDVTICSVSATANYFANLIFFYHIIAITAIKISLDALRKFTIYFTVSSFSFN